MNSFLERVDKNYSRYKPLLEKSGIIVILASPLAVRGMVGHGWVCMDRVCQIIFDTYSAEPRSSPPNISAACW